MRVLVNPVHLLQKYTSALDSVCRTGRHVHAFDFPLSVCVCVCVSVSVCVRVCVCFPARLLVFFSRGKVELHGFVDLPVLFTDQFQGEGTIQNSELVSSCRYVDGVLFL